MFRALVDPARPVRPSFRRRPYRAVAACMGRMVSIASWRRRDCRRRLRVFQPRRLRDLAVGWRMLALGSAADPPRTRQEPP